MRDVFSVLCAYVLVKEQIRRMSGERCTHPLASRERDATGCAVGH